MTSVLSSLFKGQTCTNEVPTFASFDIVPPLIYCYGRGKAPIPAWDTQDPANMNGHVFFSVKLRHSANKAVSVEEVDAAGEEIETLLHEHGIPHEFATMIDSYPDHGDLLVAYDTNELGNQGQRHQMMERRGKILVFKIPSDQITPLSAVMNGLHNAAPQIPLSAG